MYQRDGYSTAALGAAENCNLLAVVFLAPSMALGPACIFRAG